MSARSLARQEHSLVMATSLPTRTNCWGNLCATCRTGQQWSRLEYERIDEWAKALTVLYKACMKWKGLGSEESSDRGRISQETKFATVQGLSDEKPEYYMPSTRRRRIFWSTLAAFVLDVVLLSDLQKWMLGSRLDCLDIVPMISWPSRVDNCDHTMGDERSIARDAMLNVTVVGACQDGGKFGLAMESPSE